MLKLTFKGEPKAVQSFRFTKTGRKYQPTKVVDWKNYVKLQAQMQLPYDWKMLAGPLAIRVNFFFSPLESFSKKKMDILLNGGKIHKITKPDLTDNLMKGLIDALSGIVWERDQHIVKVSSEKQYGLEPLTILTVNELNEIEEPPARLGFDF